MKSTIAVVGRHKGHQERPPGQMQLRHVQVALRQRNREDVGEEWGGQGLEVGTYMVCLRRERRQTTQYERRGQTQKS